MTHCWKRSKRGRVLHAWEDRPTDKLGTTYCGEQKAMDSHPRSDRVDTRKCPLCAREAEKRDAEGGKTS